MSSTNNKKQFAEPKIKVRMVEAINIIATSDNNPDVIYPNCKDARGSNFFDDDFDE